MCIFIFTHCGNIVIMGRFFGGLRKCILEAILLVKKTCMGHDRNTVNHATKGTSVQVKAVLVSLHDGILRFQMIHSGRKT